MPKSWHICIPNDLCSLFIRPPKRWRWSDGGYMHCVRITHTERPFSVSFVCAHRRQQMHNTDEVNRGISLGQWIGWRIQSTYDGGVNGRETDTRKGGRADSGGRGGGVVVSSNMRPQRWFEWSISTTVMVYDIVTKAVNETCNLNWLPLTRNDTLQ